jgi:RHS repeat-associated protein
VYIIIYPTTDSKRFVGMLKQNYSFDDGKIVKQMTEKMVTIYIGSNFEVDIKPYVIHLPLVMRDAISQTRSAPMETPGLLTGDPYPGPGEGGESYFEVSEAKTSIKENLAMFEKVGLLSQAVIAQPPPNQTWRSYYFVGNKRVAMRVQEGSWCDEVYYLLSDHLGSTSLTIGSTGERVSELRFTPWGSTRYASGSQATDYQFTGQRNEEELGLYFFQSRFYDQELGRFISPDTLIPDPNNALDWDRYQFVRSNPIYYNDPSGNIPIPIIIGIVIVALKAIDYGWTAYDVSQFGKVLADPNASQEAKDAAAVNMALTIGFEAAEPDELLPVSLPIDDLARRRLTKIVKEVGEEASEQSFKSFARWNFRENLRRLTGKNLGDIVGMEAHHVLPQQFEKQFLDAGIENIHSPLFGSWVDASTH